MDEVAVAEASAVEAAAVDGEASAADEAVVVSAVDGEHHEAAVASGIRSGRAPRRTRRSPSIEVCEGGSESQQTLQFESPLQNE